MHSVKNEIKHRCVMHGSCDRYSAFIENLSVSYNGTRAVDGIDFVFSCGEITAIIGPNGGGKSSVLKAILGEVPYTGSIGFCSATGEGKKPRIGYVPQKVSIQPDSPINVLDLMLLSRGYLGTWIGSTQKKKSEAEELLAIVSAENLISRRVGELSGGELQRVLLACSLNPLPDLLLLDEPVSSVDVRGIEAFYEIICNLRRAYHISIVLVTHDISAIAPHAEKMILMNKSICAMGSPAEVLKHAEFRKQMGSVYPLYMKVPEDRHAGLKP